MVEAGAFPSLRDSLRRCRLRLAQDLRSVRPLFRGTRGVPVGIVIAIMGAGPLLNGASKGSNDLSAVLLVLGAVFALWFFGRMALRLVLARV
jgi:hypothetical protein